MTETTFQDTPLYAWFQQNRWYLLGGIALVVGVALYRENAPRWHHARASRSWDHYSQLLAETDRPLEERLAEARGDERIYAWFVFAQTRDALRNGDREALALLRPELEGLAGRTDVRVAGADGAEDMAAHLLGLMAPSEPPLPAEFVNPTPTGERVEIVLSDATGTTYTVVARTFSELTPNASEAFVELAREGDLDGTVAQRGGTVALTFRTQDEETLADAVADPTPDVPDLLIERPYGLFHTAGCISLLAEPGKPGIMSKSDFQILLEDSFYLDGQTTVVAQIVEGRDALAEALQILDPNEPLTLTSARVLED